MHVHVCLVVCVCVIQKKLVLHAACWSYVNRAVSHLLWPGWESSGGPGRLWVPDLHVIHSWLGGTQGEGGGGRVCPNPNSEKREGGEARRKEKWGWVSWAAGGLAACAVKEFGYDEHKDELDEFWLPLSHCHSNHHGGFYPSCTLGLIIFSSYVSQLCCLSLPLIHHIDWHEPISKTLIATEPSGTHFLPLFS